MLSSSFRPLLTAVAMLLAVIFGSTLAEQAFAQGTRLGTGDLVKITVYGQPDLSTVTRIGSDQNINFPLIGNVRIGGLSAGAAEDVISEELGRRNFVRNAQVTVLLEEQRTTSMNSVTIIGEVRDPGIYPLQAFALDGVHSLVDLVARAGGLTEDAADHLLLLNNSQDGHKNAIDLIELLQQGDLRNNIELQGGEVVLIPATEVFYIYGHVQRPGKYRIERDMTVMQAIAVSGGIRDTGSESGIGIKRGKGGKQKNVNAKLETLLLPNDVIYIKKSIF